MLCWTKSHRSSPPLSLTVGVSYVAQVHNIQCVWRVQRWNPDSALFPCSCLIFQMPQSHVVGQRAGLPAECRTPSWDAPELPAAAYPGSPKQIDHGFSSSTGVAVLQIPLKRDGYFPYAHYFHDELCPGNMFLYFGFFIYIFSTAEHLCVCVCVCVWRKTTN